MRDKLFYLTVAVACLFFFALPSSAVHDNDHVSYGGPVIQGFESALASLASDLNAVADTIVAGGSSGGRPSSSGNPSNNDETSGDDDTPGDDGTPGDDDTSASLSLMDSAIKMTEFFLSLSDDMKNNFMKDYSKDDPDIFSNFPFQYKLLGEYFTKSDHLWPSVSDEAVGDMNVADALNKSLLKTDFPEDLYLSLYIQYNDNNNEGEPANFTLIPYVSNSSAPGQPRAYFVYDIEGQKWMEFIKGNETEGYKLQPDLNFVNDLATQSWTEFRNSSMSNGTLRYVGDDSDNGLADSLMGNAELMVSAFQELETDEERKAFLGANNSAMSNDQFQAKLMNDYGYDGKWPSISSEKIHGQSVAEALQESAGFESIRSDLYLHVYLKNYGKKTGYNIDIIPFVNSDGDYRNKTNSWKAVYLYDPVMGRWMEAIDSNGAFKSDGNSIASIHSDGWNQFRMNALYGYTKNENEAAVKPTFRYIIDDNEHEQKERILWLASNLEITESSVYGYFNPAGKKQLDSTGPNFGLPVTQEMIDKNVVEPNEQFMWRIYDTNIQTSNQDLGYNIFWVSAHPNEAANVSCLKYNTATKEFTQGTVSLREDKMTCSEGVLHTYWRIDGNSFEPTPADA